MSLEDFMREQIRRTLGPPSLIEQFGNRCSNYEIDKYIIDQIRQSMILQKLRQLQAQGEQNVEKRND